MRHCFEDPYHFKNVIGHYFTMSDTVSITIHIQYPSSENILQVIVVFLLHHN